MRVSWVVRGVMMALLGFTGCATGSGSALKAPATDADLIANAMSAAPRAVAEEATIMAMDEKGKMRVLRQGTGPFTCLPDNPGSPGNDPMCVDKAGMEWAKAWMTKTTPPAGMVGFGYMLMGGSDASNDDPHAMGPAPGNVGLKRAPTLWSSTPAR